MYFTKLPHITNFSFLKRGKWKKIGLTRKGVFKTRRAGETIPLKVQVDTKDGDIFHLRFTSPRWSENQSQAELSLPPESAAPGNANLSVNRGLELELKEVATGRSLLRSVPGKSLGLCGKHSVFVFQHDEDVQYYGMGEKMLGLELTGRSTKFWNTDALGDFRGSVIHDGRIDPLYVSIPYLIIKRRNTFIGLLLHNPHAAFIQTAADVSIEGMVEVKQGKVLAIGSENGCPDLFIIYGPSLAELTRKMQKLVGVTPRPPAWSLGYHQSRWGYESIKDMRRLSGNMNNHRIPCDGLWLDIDYMDSYKVFTFDKRHFPDPAAALDELKAQGRRIVPIIDPGVKPESGYAVYDSGRRKKAFCMNPEGLEYMGLAWPGDTVFPDFSKKKVREWWSGLVEQFSRIGLDGCWLDMNDPSTGRADNQDMLFDDGSQPHDSFHNQYASGMARATRDGFLAAKPDERPFILSRSGSTGCAKWTALWTGDNVSNYTYLRKSIACSLNLALSGVPFNGPDIGGFCGTCTPGLMRDWVRAGFLFPFFRNHTSKGSGPQEPWAFDKRTLRVFREYVQLRYKLRPYLYNLFIEQERSGEAILRPLFYDFRDRKRLPLGKCDDQFMVGPSIMQAPVLEEKRKARSVILPGGQAWWSAMHARWIKGDRKVVFRVTGDKTPVFVREGAVLPVSLAENGDNSWDGNSIEFHIFLRKRGAVKKTVYSYVTDDGSTFNYQNGACMMIKISATVSGARLNIRLDHEQHSEYGKCEPKFMLYDNFASVELNIDGRKVPMNLSEAVWRFAAVKQHCWRVAPEASSAIL